MLPWQRQRRRWGSPQRTAWNATACIKTVESGKVATGSDTDKVDTDKVDSDKVDLDTVDSNKV